MPEKRDRIVETTALRTIRVVAIALGALLGIGTAGYMVLENMSPVDALYMTVITISTVGFGEVIPLSPPGRLFTIVMILGGAGMLAYAFGAGAEYVVSGSLREAFTQRRRVRMLEDVRNHTIVCGYGRMGKQVTDELHREKQPYVVIDASEAAIEDVFAKGGLGLQGNAEDEDVLLKAGIKRAKHLVASVSSDADNVFVTLTARSLNPDIYIVARANFEESEPKLLRAGASRVVLPYVITGRRVVSNLLRPYVSDFLEGVMHSDDQELVLEQVILPESSPLAGKTMAEANIRGATGVTVLAASMPEQPVVTSPHAAYRLEAGVRMVLMGTRDQLDKFNELAAIAEA